MTSDGRYVYEYDLFNRLCTVRTPGGGGTVVAKYYYDAENRRVRKEIAGGATTDYLYDGWRVIEERPVVSGVQGAASRQKVYGNYLDEVLVADTDADADGICAEDGIDTRNYYHQNSIFSVVAITNGAGEIVEAYEYDPYGKHITITDGNDADAIVNFDANDSRTSPSLVGNSNTFTGQIFDPESGLHYYKNRYYSCELGRFVSRDPIGYADGPNTQSYAYLVAGTVQQVPTGPVKIDAVSAPNRDPVQSTAYADGMNLYQYVRSNPQVYLDPYGLMSRAAWDCRCRDTGEAKRQLDLYRKQAALIHKEPYGSGDNIGCGFCAMGIDGYLSGAPTFKMDCWEWKRIKANRNGWPPVHQFVAMKPKRDDTPTYDHPRNHASPIFDGWDSTSNFSRNSKGGIGECHFSEGRVGDYKDKWPRGW